MLKFSVNLETFFLCSQVLNEGMIVLGRITEITDYFLHVSLPGLTAGRVPVTQISEPYSQLLHSTQQNDDEIDVSKFFRR